MPKITTENTQSKTAIRKDFDESVLWPAMVAATRQAIDNGTPQEHALHVVVQYLRGMNQGVPVAALRDMAHDAIAVESDTQAPVTDDSSTGGDTTSDSVETVTSASNRRKAA